MEDEKSGVINSDSLPFVVDAINFYLSIFGQFVSDAQYKERLNICAGCEFHGGVQIPNVKEIITVPGCLKCGCPDATKPKVLRYFHPVKLKMIRVGCPEKKWPTVAKSE